MSKKCKLSVSQACKIQKEFKREKLFEYEIKYTNWEKKYETVRGNLWRWRFLSLPVSDLESEWYFSMQNSQCTVYL